MTEYKKFNSIFKSKSKLKKLSRSKSIPVSTDHKPNLKKERDRIYKAGSTVNVEGRIDGNLNLSRAIGDLAHKLTKDITMIE
jgi:serine/threonine protein phosphatase PrpC